ncbi:acyltransferase domain-containing protein, partial [Streptomyces sp. A012304]|uniref:acyltransferase domain-containing protein n=1 Tax=Streptomyces sp. A012304 TaxID=375446 RepID=UPI0022318065
VNGPRSTVVAGDPEALDALRAHCAERDVRARVVPAAYASHSAAVEVLRDRMLEELAPVSPLAGSGTAFYSTVTGGRLDTSELDAGYWFRNLREPVRFEPVI